jgi:hypothetical protein
MSDQPDGMKNGSSKAGAATVAEVRRENMPQLVNPKHVNLADGGSGAGDKEPKKKKQGCCSIM